MMIDRRDFIASATLVCVAPAIHLLPSQQPLLRGKSKPRRFDDPWVERSR